METYGTLGNRPMGGFHLFDYSKTPLENFFMFS